MQDVFPWPGFDTSLLPLYNLRVTPFSGSPSELAEQESARHFAFGFACTGLPNFLGEAAVSDIKPIVQMTERIFVFMAIAFKG
jgi:hypothetical protein